MRIAIIIPAFNEEDFIGKTLESLAHQTKLPTTVILVDDNSTDQTLQIAKSFLTKLPLHIVEHQSHPNNVPGSKVVDAFLKGLSTINIDDYDVICKYDADLIFPAHYLQEVSQCFEQEECMGMAAGHCTIPSNGEWIVENLNNKDHIRGALKAYSTDCYKDIGGIKSSIGWDTADEMMARFNGWKVKTIDHLYVKHLKPTGNSYSKNSLQLQGEAFYKLRYGWNLTLLTAVKMAYKRKDISILKDYLKGYYIAKKNNLQPLLSVDEGCFLRSYRWRAIRSKFISKG